MFKMYALYREKIKHGSPYQDGFSGKMIQLNKNEESFMLQERKRVPPDLWLNWHTTHFDTLEELESSFNKIVEAAEFPLYWEEDPRSPSDGEWSHLGTGMK